MLLAAPWLSALPCRIARSNMWEALEFTESCTADPNKIPYIRRCGSSRAVSED